jgi:DNA uptake protein ComE-like DNA-binding protein
MRPPRFAPSLLATATLLVTFAGCQDAPSREGVEAPGADSAASAPAATPATAAAVPAEGTLLDPNQATREQLLTVPGLNEAAADALIQGRPYADMRGVDQALAGHLAAAEQRKAVYAHLWKPLDLNSASKEEILLIPGVGERMHHEFEEYRPYKTIEQFRREIGKYVDEAEVARLERYVSIR